MKTRSLFSFALLFACAWLSLFPLPSLAQEDPTGEGEEPTAEDAAGVWKASEGILYTTDEDQEGVLAALGAEPSADGERWTAQTYSTDGSLAQATFAVVLVDPSQVVALAVNPGDVVPCPHPNHIVYKNSICGQQYLGYSGICQALFGGTSRRTSQTSYKSCKRQVGPTYCVNVKSIIGWTQYFDDGACSGALINMVPTNGWTCR